MEQIRNITFACLNQSTLNDRVLLSEQRLVKMNSTCIRLNEMDKQIKYAAEEMHKQVSERLQLWKDDQAAVQRNNEKVMSEHKMRLSANGETINKHRELIDENKHMMAANQDLINKIGTKLERTRDNLQNEIVNVNNDI